ncbi:hypothetical protein KCP74_17930 [Salmonella enterica subsp. enterica]|nr:hypothetical protein KCP74_17930 [Salmonella enterica subsp. enterica]
MNQALPGVVRYYSTGCPFCHPKFWMQLLVQQLMGKPRRIGERCRRWINTVCSACGVYIAGDIGTARQGAVICYAHNCEVACAIRYRCLMTRGYRLNRDPVQARAARHV